MTSAPHVICSSPNPTARSRWFRASYCSPWSRTGMAIKPILSSPFPLWLPIALRRQAVKFHRRSSLLPPRPLANSGCSGEPLPLSLAQCASPCRRESPGINLACSRALQVLLRSSPTSPSRCCHFGDRFRQGHDSPRPLDATICLASSLWSYGEHPCIPNPSASFSSRSAAVLRWPLRWVWLRLTPSPFPWAVGSWSKGWIWPLTTPCQHVNAVKPWANQIQPCVSPSQPRGQIQSNPNLNPI